MFHTMNFKWSVLMYVILGLLCFPSHLVLAQEDAPVKGIGMGYSMFGSSVLDLSAINSRLKNHGYSTMADNFFSVGGGGHAIINNRLIIGGEGHSLLGEENVSNMYKSSLIGGYGLFDVGYVVFNKSQLRVYPMLGIGGGGMTLKIRQKPTSLSFNDVLNNPERGVELSTSGFLLSFAIGADYLLLIGGDEHGKGGFVFGIRAGYTLSPFQHDWMLDELELSDAPKTEITGPFITVMFGGGGME